MPALLSPRGLQALKKFLDENKGKYTKPSDHELTKAIITLLNKPEFLHKAKQQLSKSQAMGQIKKLAASLNCGTADLLKNGPLQCKRNPQKSQPKGKGRKRSPSEDSNVIDSEEEEEEEEEENEDANEDVNEDANEDLNEDVNEDVNEDMNEDENEDENEDVNEENSKTQVKAAPRSRTLRSNTKPLQTDDELHDKPPAPIIEHDYRRVLMSPEEHQMLRLYRQAENDWAKEIPPGLQLIPVTMEKIDRACETAIKALIVDMNYHRLDFDHLPDNSGTIGRVLANQPHGMDIGETLMAIYHKNGLGLETFLRAVAGASIHHWVLAEGMIFDRSSKLAFAVKFVDGVLSRDRRDYDGNKASLMQALGDVEGIRSTAIRQHAEKLTESLLRVLLGFAKPTPSKESVKPEDLPYVFENYKKNMINAIELACRLQHTLSKCPSHFEAYFPRSGQKFDAKSMTRVAEGTNAVKEGEFISICISPAIYGADVKGARMYPYQNALVI